MDIDRSKLRNSNGVRITRGLFLEEALEPYANILYTLKDYEDKGYPSLYLLYLESTLVDPTEYSFACQYFSDWEHWVLVSKASWFKDHLRVWRDEVTMRAESLYVARMEALAAKGGKEAFVANKYLLERLRKPAGAFPVGRPTKGSTRAEIERTASLEALEAKQVEIDLQRLKGLQ